MKNAKQSQEQGTELNVKLEHVNLIMTPKEAQDMMEVMMEFCPMKKIESFITSCRNQVQVQVMTAAKQQGLIPEETEEPTKKK